MAFCHWPEWWPGLRAEAQQLAAHFGNRMALHRCAVDLDQPDGRLRVRRMPDRGRADQGDACAQAVRMTAIAATASSTCLPRRGRPTARRGTGGTDGGPKLCTETAPVMRSSSSPAQLAT